MKASQYDITFAKRTVLYQHSSNRTTTFIQTRFNDNTLTWCIRYRFQFKNFRLQQYCIQKFINALTSFRRYVYELVLATPLFWDNV